MNIGIFAGGVADGYRKEQENQRKQAEEKRRQEEMDRQEAERKKYEEIVKSVSENDKKRREVAGQAQSDMPKINPMAAAPAGGLTGEIIANPTAQPSTAASLISSSGIGGFPAQEARTGAPFAQDGISLPAQQEKKAQQAPQYREHTYDDRFQMVDDMYGRLLEAGMFEKAGQVGQTRTALMAEKLQIETKQREQAASGFVASLDGGDEATILAAGRTLADMIPDGKEMTSIKRLPDGKYEVSYGGGQPVVMEAGQLKQSAIALVDWKTALNYGYQQQNMKLHEAQQAQTAKHQDETLKEMKRRNIATEGIARSKSADGGEGTTAEIKNVNFLIKNGIAKTPAEAWEMVRTGKTPAGEQVVSDGMGGVMIYNRDSGQVSKIDGRGKETVVRQPGGVQPSAPGQPAQTEQPPIAGARKAPDGNWYVQKDGKWHLVN